MKRNNNLIKRLRAFATELQRDQQDKVTKGSYASGALASSYKSSVEVRGTNIFIQLDALGSWKYIEFGRGAGKKRPPIAAISDWLAAKGLSREFAFPVAQKIAEKGITAKPYLRDFLDKKLEQLSSSALAAYGDDVKLDLDEGTKFIN